MARASPLGGFVDLERQRLGGGEREYGSASRAEDAVPPLVHDLPDGRGFSEPRPGRNVSSMEPRVKRRSVGTRHIRFEILRQSVAHRSVQGPEDAVRIVKFGRAADATGAPAKVAAPGPPPRVPAKDMLRHPCADDKSPTPPIRSDPGTGARWRDPFMTTGRELYRDERAYAWNAGRRCRRLGVRWPRMLNG